MTAFRAAPLVLAGLLAGCATPSVTLLKSAEGKQGAVALLEENGRPVDTQIDELDSRTNLSGKPRTRSIDASKLKARQLALLANLPPPPMRQPLYFESGTTQLTGTSRPDLDRLKTEISSRSGAEVQVTGYTDTVGSLDDNDRLSLRRAEEVRDALAREGIDQALMTAVGRGERELRINTGDNVAEPLNRRVVVIVR